MPEKWPEAKIQRFWSGLLPCRTRTGFNDLQLWSVGHSSGISFFRRPPKQRGMEDAKCGFHVNLLTDHKQNLIWNIYIYMEYIYMECIYIWNIYICLFLWFNQVIFLRKGLSLFKVNVDVDSEIPPTRVQSWKLHNIDIENPWKSTSNS